MGGVAAGIRGGIVMAAFQKLVEMPLTGRAESHAPADFAEKVLPISTSHARRRRVLNYVAHFGVGSAWGIAHALVERPRLRGQRAVATAFARLYVRDVLVNVALGLYRPWRWSAQRSAIDVGEKLPLSEATGYYEQIAAGS